jgi:hypothetical protein
MAPSTSELVQFVGRFHPLVVHLAIGFIVLLVIFEVLMLLPRFAPLKPAVGVILIVTLPAVSCSVLCGLLLARTGGYDAELVALHRNAAYFLGAGCVLLAIVHWCGWSRVYQGGLLIVVVLLGFTSHLGGSLTHGKDYLTEYAPGVIKSLLRVKKKPPQINPGSSASSFYTATVQPALDRYCVSCHGAEKAKGKLRLDTFDWLMKGGSSGPSVIPGDPAKSDLLIRMVSPPEADDHMPPAGKPQPPSELVEVLRWWIASGASSTESLAQLNPPEKIRDLLPKASAPAP